MTAIVAFEQVAIEEMCRLAGSETVETCAFGLVAAAGRRNGRPRYVVRGLRVAPDDAYISRTAVSAVLSPAFCIEIANAARREGLGVLIAHTHPGEGAPGTFSSVDDEGEIPLSRYFRGRMPDVFHAAAVFTQHGASCRELGGRELVRIQAVGSDVRWLYDQPKSTVEAGRYARQVLAFGPGIQEVLGAIRVAIVGLGGTGSFVATELAYLGVKEFLLIDPDRVDETNLNRLLGAEPDDVGTSKVSLASKRIRKLNQNAQCVEFEADIVDNEVAHRLIDTDFVFLCTDSHASRAVVNQLAYQYLIPCIDMGVAIHTKNHAVDHVVGRVQMLSSGLPCLVCAGWIDSNQVRFEMMSQAQRRADPYFSGGGVEQPAVISLNGTVASVAITTFLSAVAALPSRARMIFYDAIKGSMRPAVMNPAPDCIVCSLRGALARGDSWSLATRRSPND